MPEGHSVHRIAKQFVTNFVGTRVRLSSPQGRFAAGAKLLDGQEMVNAQAVGKQMFLEFANGLWLRVHLGIYGAWDFSGEVKINPDILIHAYTPGHSKLGQTGEYAQLSAAANMDTVDSQAEDSVTSIGAPRKTRVRMAESEKQQIVSNLWPPEPVGQVRVRLLNESVCADLRGPTVCEVITKEEKNAVINRLGPDPANDASASQKQRFIERASKKNTAIALVLMDQSVIAGIGNVYRAEMLYRAKIDPHTPAKNLSNKQLAALWQDWVHLLSVGVHVGQMITIDGLSGDDYQKALRERDSRHWVYKKEGTACPRCSHIIVLEEINARKLYWCPGCQK